MSKYFTKPNDLIGGTTARADQVNTRIEMVDAAFEQVEKDVEGRSIVLPEVIEGEPETSNKITQTAPNRANKVVGFDANGNVSILDAAFTWKGDWATNTAYLVNDVFKDNDATSATYENIYFVSAAHTASILADDITAGSVSLAIDVSAVKGYKDSAAISASTATTQAGIATTQAGIATTKATEASASAAQAQTALGQITPYSHPTYAGDDIDVDTGPLTGATVVSDIDFNVTTDTLGHVTDANGTVYTRTLTPSDIGAQTAGTYNTIIGTDSNVSASGATVIDSLTMTNGVITNHATRTLTPGDIGAQTAGTYNTVIGTDTDINTSGATIIDNLYMTDGVITSHGTRNLTPSDIGAQTAGTYNTIIGTDTDINTSGATIIDSLTMTDGVITSHGTRNLAASDIGAQPAGTYNTILGTDADINTSGATIIDNVYMTDGVITYWSTRNLTASDIGAQTAGTYNTVIGTDTDVNTSGATIIDSLTMTDGVITSHGTRTLTANAIGAQPAGTYNMVIGTDTDVNTSGATIIDNLMLTDGVVTAHGTRALTPSDIGAAPTSHTHSNYLPVSGGSLTGDVTSSGSFIFTGRNKSAFGSYDSYKTDQIWSMGTSYTNHVSGTNFGNLYGLAYKHTNNSTGGTMGGGHQMVWVTNGTPKGSIGESGIWSAGNITAYSDIRVKDNIKIIDNALDKVKQLNGYTFDRTDIEIGRQTGVIAQEVLKVLPEVVTGDDQGHYAVAYGNMVGLLIEAIKEQQTQIDELTALIGDE